MNFQAPLSAPNLAVAEAKGPAQAGQSPAQSGPRADPAAALAVPLPGHVQLPEQDRCQRDPSTGATVPPTTSGQSHDVAARPALTGGPARSTRRSGTSREHRTGDLARRQSSRLARTPAEYSAGNPAPAGPTESITLCDGRYGTGVWPEFRERPYWAAP